jgi:transcriptional regulator with XRE-family HTH domain
MPRDELEKELGGRLRAVRVARRITQGELAAQANVSLGALQHLERGAGATVGTLVRVLRALGREAWIDQLAPAPGAFNPLDLLGRAGGRPVMAKGASRVRRRRDELTGRP